MYRFFTLIDSDIWENAASHIVKKTKNKYFLQSNFQSVVSKMKKGRKLFIDFPV